MPGPRVTPVYGDENLPEKVDVVVIGGGIIGASTALELAERGLKVALCEKGGIGQEQSSRNWGWVRISRRDPKEIPLMAETLKLWPELAKRTGRDVGYKQAGIMFAAKTDKDMAKFERWTRHLAPVGLSAEVMKRDAFDTVMGGCEEKVKGGLFTAVDGRAEPQLAAPAIAEAARAAGASVLTECAVRGVETSGGAVSGVITERGPIACDAVVLAGGAWSRLFSGNFGLELPQLKVQNTVLRTSPIEGGPEPAYWNDTFAFRKRADGGYSIADGSTNIAHLTPDSFRLFKTFLPAFLHTIGDVSLRLSERFVIEAVTPRRWDLDEPSPFEYTRVLDPKPDRKLLTRILQDAASRFPIFKGAKILQGWAGLMDVTPDAVPVISGVDGKPGFYIATGFSGHGFGIGPGAGRLMAQLVTGETPMVDPHHFRFSRFSDGSRLVPDDGF
ncbi:D-amino-acid oxidase [Rhodobacter sp. TJ_12]|uniref:NAD(P)/FAD-dependent oxidoreductase n=1 Tax=Rhodobacter sp. TJ_12 TaxID=2029399 RepID=UPI001CC10FEE|nr:FAD-binding oxidoreductase [Rhodobacter sp. TJ_12]MBZ4021551.1 D-amino-acid oxidase [Rhodobacter sp. TJ_12]